MNRSLIPALAVAVVVACAESAPEPVSPTGEAAARAEAAGWVAAEITAGLPVDEATRQELTATLEELQPAIVELHRRHEAAAGLTGDERAARLAELHADATSLHEQHRELLGSLDPAVADALKARVHERMAAHHGDADHGSLHERMRRLHGAGHQRPAHGGH